MKSGGPVAADRQQVHDSLDLGAKWFSFVTPRSGGVQTDHNAPFDIALSRGLHVFADAYPRVFYDAVATFASMLALIDSAATPGP